MKKMRKEKIKTPTLKTRDALYSLDMDIIEPHRWENGVYIKIGNEEVMISFNKYSNSVVLRVCGTDEPIVVKPLIQENGKLRGLSKLFS
ncbi:MAG: hypothetical protein ACE5JB_16365 [bacterium]